MTQNVKFPISVILEHRDNDARTRDDDGFYKGEKECGSTFWQSLGLQNLAEQHLYAEKKNDDMLQHLENFSKFFFSKIFF